MKNRKQNDGKTNVAHKFVRQINTAGVAKASRGVHRDIQHSTMPPTKTSQQADSKRQTVGGTRGQRHRQSTRHCR